MNNENKKTPNQVGKMAGRQDDCPDWEKSVSNELIFVPHELKTIEVDVEKRLFKVNGEDFGHGCTHFSISCDAEEGYQVRMEIDTKLIFASYDGISRTSVSERPAWRLRKTGGQECSNQSE